MVLAHTPMSAALWAWDNDGTWLPYDPALCTHLETAYTVNPASTERFTVMGRAYALDLSTMVQVNL